MVISKQTIVAFIFGMVIAATAYLGYVFFQSIKVMNANQATLGQIVNIINESQKAAQGQAAPSAVQ